MWRAIFLAIGFYLILLGVQCLGVQKFVLTLHEPPKQREPGILAKEPPKQGPKRVLEPPDWAPYSLMSTGAIVCLYSFTIPLRLRGK
jgi:hypothetical protein